MSLADQSGFLHTLAERVRLVLGLRDLESWRSQLDEKIILVATVLLPVGLIAALPYYLREGLYWIIAFDMALFLFGLSLLLIRRGWFAPTGLKAMGLVFIASAVFVVLRGPGGVRLLWLTLVVVLAAALYGMRGALWATAADGALLLVAFTLLPRDYAPWRELFESTGLSVGVTFFHAGLLVLVIGLTVAALLEQLDGQLRATRESQERYRLLAENVSDVIWTADLDLNFTYVSPSIKELRGYSPEEVMTQSVMDMTDEEGVKHIAEAFSGAVQKASAGDPACFAPVLIRLDQTRKDGTPIETHSTARLVPGADGRPALIVGVTRDVTELNRVERERQSLQAQLFEAQKMEAVGRLAGGVAHDFNNIICAIRGNAELALMDLPAHDEVRASVEIIDAAAGRAADLTEQLLAFSRKQVIEPRVVELGGLVEGMRHMLVRLIGEDVTLRVDSAPGLGRVRVDPGQIEQVVMNLVINARDAMPDGGEIRVELTNIELGPEDAAAHLGCHAGHCVRLSVSDTGTGMSPDVRARVFEPFFTTKEQGQGTGLGLATALGIVEQNGGRIQIDSEPGRGTTFELYFPLVQAAIAAPDPQAPQGREGGEERVLLVEDDRDVREVAEQLLGRLGYDVLVASCGEEALALLRDEPGTVDLLFTDLVMPGLNGRELADRVQEQRPGIKVLFASGYTQNIIARHGVLDEGVQFISKPYSAAALAEMVRQALDVPTA